MFTAPIPSALKLFLCFRQLTSLESIDLTSTRQRIATLKSDVQGEIGQVWAQHFNDAYESEDNLEGPDIDVMYSNFVKLIRKQMIGYKIEDKYAKVNVVKSWNVIC